MSKALMVGVWLTAEEKVTFERLRILFGEEKNAPVFKKCFAIVAKAIEENGITDGVKPRIIRSQMDLWRGQQ